MIKTRFYYFIVSYFWLLTFPLMAALFPILSIAQDENDEPLQITVELGDYAFNPDQIEVINHTPVELILVNKDNITPHTFTLMHENAGLSIDVSIPGGGTKTVRFTPTQAGTFTFFCSKKLIFMKSHREKGMEGNLVVRSTEE